MSDGWGGHREALLAVYGKAPPYQGRGRPPTQKRPQAGWRYLHVVQQRAEGRVIYGNDVEGRAQLGENTASVERPHLTARHMNGRLVRKTLGFSKAREMFGAACAWADLVYNLARHVNTLRVEVNDGRRRWPYRSPMMAAGLADHIWTISELLSCVPVPINTEAGDHPPSKSKERNHRTNRIARFGFYGRGTANKPCLFCVSMESKLAETWRLRYDIIWL